MQTYPRDMGLMDLYFADTLTVHQGDSDGDGVPDLLDSCNSTPAGAIVGPTGTIAGDLNGDCKVDLQDVAIMQNTFTGP